MGDPYGPYLIHRYTMPIKGPGLQQARICFLLSTWNPYNVMLMTAVISEKPPQVFWPFSNLLDRLARAVNLPWR